MSAQVSHHIMSENFVKSQENRIYRFFQQKRLNNNTVRRETKEQKTFTTAMSATSASENLLFRRVCHPDNISPSVNFHCVRVFIRFRLCDFTL